MSHSAALAPPLSARRPSFSRALQNCPRALPRAHLCSRARASSSSSACSQPAVAADPDVGLLDAPAPAAVRQAVLDYGVRAAPAHVGRTELQVLEFLEKPVLPAKDFALECTLGAPSTAVDTVVGEPQLFGAAWSSAPDVGGCSCGGGSGGSGGGGGLDGNLLLCWRC